MFFRYNPTYKEWYEHWITNEYYEGAYFTASTRTITRPRYRVVNDTIYYDAIRPVVITDVSADGNVGREKSRKVLVCDGVVQVGLDAGECKTVQVQVDVEIVCGHVSIDFHVQVAAVCKLETDINTGGVIFKVNCRNVDREILDVELGTNFGILINNIAFFKNDVPQAKLDREAGCDFCGALARAILDLLFFWMLGVVDAVFLREKFQDVGEVKAFAVLRCANVKSLHVDVANVQRSRDELERVDVHAELVECDKFCLVVGFQDGKRIDIENVGERVQADVLDGDASTDHLLGVFFDVAAGNLWPNEECHKVDDDE